MSVRLRSKWLWVRVQLRSLNPKILRLFWTRSPLTFSQLQCVDSLWNAYVTWQEHIVKCTVQTNTRNLSQSFRPVWLNGWVFVYKLSVCGFESSYSDIKYHSLLWSSPTDRWWNMLQTLDMRKNKKKLSVEHTLW